MVWGWQDPNKIHPVTTHLIYSPILPWTLKKLILVTASGSSVPLSLLAWPSTCLSSQSSRESELGFLDTKYVVSLETISSYPNTHGVWTMQFNSERKLKELTYILHVESQNCPKFRSQPCAPISHDLAKCLKLGHSITPPPCSITELISWTISGRRSHHHPPCFNSTEALWIPTFVDSSYSFTKQEFWLNHRPVKTVPSLSALSSPQSYRKNTNL